MTKREKILIVAIIVSYTLFAVLCYLASNKPPKGLHPLQQKVAVDSAKYIEVGKRMDNKVNVRETHETRTIYYIPKMLDNGTQLKVRYSQSDSIKMFVSDSLLKYGRYR